MLPQCSGKGGVEVPAFAKWTAIGRHCLGKMSNVHSDFVTQTLTPTTILRLNSILPPGFRFDPVSYMKKVDKQVSKAVSTENEPGRRGRKRTRPWRTDKFRTKSGGEPGERDWGLKVGGEPARICFEIVQNLKRHALSGPFIQPVDPVALNLPDYLEVVKDPIDLSTVERNLKAGVYNNSQQFANDVRRIWLNAFTYNAHESEMFYITLELATYFEKLFKEAENLVFSTDTGAQKLNRDKEALMEYMDRPMSLMEKRLLATNLRKLNREHAAAVAQIVYGNKKTPAQHFQFNVEKLPPRTCRELEKYVKLMHQAACRSNRQRNLVAFKRTY